MARQLLVLLFLRQLGMAHSDGLDEDKVECTQDCHCQCSVDEDTTMIVSRREYLGGY
jgi:hypothetical protein